MMIRWILNVDLVVIFFCLCAPGVGHALQYRIQIDDPGIKLTQADQIQLKTFTNHVIDLIPSQMSAGLPEKVLVRFKKLSSHSSLLLPHCVSEVLSESSRPSATGVDVYGQILWDASIELNSLFIPEILKGESGSSTYPCGHRNAYRLAMATLIHELSHLYDESYSVWKRGVVSSDRRYQRLAGWSKRAELFGKVARPLNGVIFRSPDPYEFQSIEEHFAVNMEYFLLDPEYGLRRPALHSYLVDTFSGYQPYELPKLEAKIYRHTKSGGIDQSALVSLDPDRIYQIHSFLAAPQGVWVSRYGHSMFRLIVCAPERPEVGPDCLKDVQHHLVLSYSAYVEEAQLSSWSGLSGGYPTQPFIFPLNEVVEFYNKIELRDIVSTPIRLSVMEKRRILYRILEQYWEYQSRYYVLSNNCSVESGHLLKGVLGDELKGFKAYTPIQLEAKLRELGRLDESVHRDRKESIRLGYFFPSVYKTLEESFGVLRSQIKEWRWKDLDEYLHSSNAEQRRNQITQLIEAKKKGAEGLARVFASLYFLESYLELNAAHALSSKAFTEMEALARSGDHKNFTEIHDASLSKLRSSLPMSLLHTGYGVAQESDFKAEDHHAVSEAWEKQEEILKDWIQKRFHGEYQEIQDIQQNKKILLPQMRRK